MIACLLLFFFFFLDLIAILFLDWSLVVLFCLWLKGNWGFVMLKFCGWTILIFVFTGHRHSTLTALFFFSLPLSSFMMLHGIYLVTAPFFLLFAYWFLPCYSMAFQHINMLLCHQLHVTFAFYLMLSKMKYSMEPLSSSIMLSINFEQAICLGRPCITNCTTGPCFVFDAAQLSKT